MKKRYEHEHERKNVTPKAFYNYCKKQLAKKGVDIEEWINFDLWSIPIEESHTEIKHDNGKVEKAFFLPYELQLYLQDSYNFIMEFYFDTETTGHGYMYLTEYETETETVETVEETETLENTAADPVENRNYRPTEKEVETKKHVSYALHQLKKRSVYKHTHSYITVELH